jgi:uncharacterized protein (TIGR02996 family)
MDAEYEAFVRAVIADPDSDEPRLVFADWLEERGDPRGEFIRVEIQLAKIDDDHELPQFRDLHRREVAALEASKDDWFAIRTKLSSWDCRRGFLYEASVDCPEFLAVREELFREHPLRRLRIRGVEQFAGVVDFAPLERLAELELGCQFRQITIANAQLLAQSPLTRIDKVDIRAIADGQALRILKEAFGKRLTVVTPRRTRRRNNRR